MVIPMTGGVLAALRMGAKSIMSRRVMLKCIIDTVQN